MVRVQIWIFKYLRFVLGNFKKGDLFLEFSVIFFFIFFERSLEVKVYIFSFGLMQEKYLINYFFILRQRSFFFRKVDIVKLF